MPKRTLRCALEDVADWHPNLYLEPHFVACAAVLGKYSASPSVFEVECENISSRWLGRNSRFTLEVSWTEETDHKAARLRATMQSRPLVENAAVALAMVLTHQLVELGRLDVTDYSDRADYYSLEAACVLEISGTETLAELGRRHREKVAQALANPSGWDAYVVVCALSAQGHHIRFSRHRGEEPTDGPSET